MERNRFATKGGARGGLAQRWARRCGLVGVSCFASLLAACERDTPPDIAAEERRADVTPEAPSAARPPRGFEPIEVAGVAGTTQGHAVVLATSEWALPILVGPSEGLSIELRLAGGRFHRPLTHDLIDSMLRELGGRIESVRVERAEQAVFHSVIVLNHGGKRAELDARTSDAIALALGSDVPIFVRSELLKRDGIRVDELRQHAETPPREPVDFEAESRPTTTL